MNHTKIEWVVNPDGTQGYTWNPVTGCKFKCKFRCYAERMTNRFKGKPIRTKFVENAEVEQIIKGEQTQLTLIDEWPSFDIPTLWRARLQDPINKKPCTIFVCSMGELFGDWIPTDWIDAVLETVDKCPQHTFLFLTKNPSMYPFIKFPDNCWLGTTVTKTDKRMCVHRSINGRCFISFEPLLGPIDGFGYNDINWIIIGTLNRNGKPVKPENGGTRLEWIENIMIQARRKNIPFFLKDSVHKAFPNRLPKIRKLPYLENV